MAALFWRRVGQLLGSTPGGDRIDSGSSQGSSGGLATAVVRLRQEGNSGDQVHRKVPVTAMGAMSGIATFPSTRSTKTKTNCVTL